MVDAFLWTLALGLWLGGFMLGRSIGGREGGIVGSLLGATLAMLVFSVGKRTRVRVLKKRALLAQPSTDERPIVLYLRTFGSDAITEQPTSLLRQTTEEEHLARLMEEIGPFVAVGRPGEELPPLGARRRYFQHREWQNGVASMMSQAQLVILRLGQTAGLLWEVTTAQRILRPHQLILLVPKGQLVIRGLIHELNKVFPVPLPSITFLDAETMAAGSLVGLVYFEQGWVPKFAEFEDPPLGTESPTEGPFPVSVRMAMRPILARTGADLKAPEKRFAAPLLLFAFVVVVVLLGLMRFRW